MIGHEREYLKLIPLIPLLVAAFNGIFGRYIHRMFVGNAAMLAIFTSFVYSVRAVVDLANLPGDAHLEQVVTSWITTGGLSVPLSLMVDQLTGVMLLVITGIGTLIHLFSIGYMDHDEGWDRYFSALNLFCAFMLILVMSTSLPVMFIGWEGVGACSYLLIGFYYTEDEKASAGKKAFIVNRVGDVFFMLGMLLLAMMMKTFVGKYTLDFYAIREAADRLGSQWGMLQLWSGESGLFQIPLTTAVCLLLFAGATGKSAQIPLYVWLPDAMAGPTPVSALIHAATMVTSGIFMICRLSHLFATAHFALNVIAWVGALTALSAALVAMVQRDIKKVLAYSTVSQLGYMFLALGVGAFSSAMFHLLTHAFFKGLLFLGAGAVIHSLHGEQDIFKMGGLKSKMPGTYWTFLAGTLAIAGIPPLAGFFSKDEILYNAWRSDLGSPLLYIVGMITAALTAFYMTRMFVLVWHAPSNVDKHVRKKLHDSPPSMLVPLIVLAVCAVFAGFLNRPHVLGGGEWFATTLEPVLGHAMAEMKADHALELGLMILSVMVALVGCWTAKLMYLDPERRSMADDLGKSSIYQLLFHKFYIDEIYDAVIVRPVLWFSKFLKNVIDTLMIDTILVHGPGFVARELSGLLRDFQSGDVQRYLLLVTLGTVSVLVYVIRLR